MAAEQQKRGRGRPATGETPKRYFRMDESDWQLVTDAAKRRGETTSDFIRRVLLNSARKLVKNG